MKFLAALLLALSISAPTIAETILLPATGFPAFSIDVPEGYRVLEDHHGNILLMSLDHSNAYVLNMITDPAIKTTSSEEIASTVNKEAGGEPFTRKGNSTLSGYTTDAFYSSMVNPGGKLNVVYEVIKLDSSHAAAMATMTVPNITAEQIAATLAVRNNIHIVLH